MAVEDPIETVKRALVVRDAGQQDEAAQILVELLKDHPKVGAAYYELAFIQRLQGKHREAVRTFDNACSYQAADSRMLLLGGHMLYSAGCHDEGDETLNQLRPSTEAERQNLKAMFNFGSYLRQFPLERALVILDRLKRKNYWVEAADVADKVSYALEQERPFALIRLGDGEGGMLTISEQDEAHHQAMYKRNRDELIRIWFGSEFQWQDGPFWKQAQHLPEAMAEADVIGIPYESWLMHEYRISSLRGIPSLVNVYRCLSVSKSSSVICSQHIHLDLFRSGRLIPIIKSAKAVHVVTCLPAIRLALIERLELSQVEVHLIPAEQGSKAALGSGAGSGIHYPDAFEQLLFELSHPAPGHLFLVAAGLLGKFYCQAIKRGGGVALDVGSLVDAWLERPTRPGYGADLRL